MRRGMLPSLPVCADDGVASEAKHKARPGSKRILICGIIDSYRYCNKLLVIGVVAHLLALRACLARFRVVIVGIAHQLVLFHSNLDC